MAELILGAYSPPLRGEGRMRLLLSPLLENGASSVVMKEPPRLGYFFFLKLKTNNCHMKKQKQNYNLTKLSLMILFKFCSSVASCDPTPKCIGCHLQICQELSVISGQFTIELFKI